jgi:RNA polymerase primary sigma factor
MQEQCVFARKNCCEVKRASSTTRLSPIRVAAAEILQEPLGLASPDPIVGLGVIRKSRIADLPAHLGRLCEASLLTPNQERILFQRMNFLRYQAEVFRTRLNPDKPSKPAIELVERLLVLADWHRDQIVQANMRLVFSIVKKFVNHNNAFDDLLSDGIIALMRAVEKFDYDRGFRFSTYATQVVRRNAYRYVVTKQKERAKIAGGIQELGLDVSDEERQPAISEHRWHELRTRLAVMLGDLDRREKFIIRARFSLGSHRRVHTLQALADRLGVSKERVRQLEKRALDKLSLMAGEVQLAELET